MDIDPWGSDSVEDYSRLFEEFGINEFDTDAVDEPMDLMRRGIIFGERDYDLITDAMANGDEFAALSGFMPSGELHMGHLMVMRELVWHQRRGADTYFLIADLEAHSARGMSWDECERYARQYVLSLLALGFDPEEGTVYRQSRNRRLQDLAFELGEHTNFNELNAIYDFDGSTNIAHMQSVLTQAADILYPQLDGPKPTVIPVGADQDPHLRLTRGLARRMRDFGVAEAYASFEIEDEHKPVVRRALRREGTVTARDLADEVDVPELAERLRSGGKEELRERVRVLSRDAPEDAFGAVREELEDVGRVEVFDEHIDVYDADRAEVESTVRRVEVEHGGYGFYPPSSIYHRFMTGLTGGKMSSSVPKSHIAVTDDPGEAHDKVMSATTGGRETAEEQRERGGEPDDCPVYELYAYSVARDDGHAETVYDECANGDRLCGGCKTEAADLTAEFLEEHQRRREEARDMLDAVDAV